MKKYEKYKGLAYLVILLVVIPSLVWNMTISETVGMWRSTRKITARIALLEADTLSQGDGVSNDGSKGMLFDGQWLETIYTFTEKHKAKVVKFTPYTSEKTEGAVLYTAELILEGSYAGLVRIIEHIEKDKNQCHLISVSFKTSHPDRSRPQKLTTRLILQQIIITPYLITEK